MVKCEDCGFECASEKLMAMHKERHTLGISEREEKKLFNSYRHEIIKSDDKTAFIKKLLEQR